MSFLEFSMTRRLFSLIIYSLAVEVKCTDVKVFKSFVYWANSRITEEESNVKNKENGTDGAL